MKVLDNARELVEEAELLLGKERYARAYALAHLACEEMAKIPMLVRAVTGALMGLEFDWAKLERRLRSHRDKVTGILFIDYVVDPNMEDDADIERLREDLKRLPLYNKLKNWSLYTDLSEGVFHKPSEVISEHLAAGLVKLARGRLTFFETVELPSQSKLEEMVKTPLFKALWKEQRELRGRKR